uniref:Bag family molecular chaperone regulator 1-like protein n=1 Tax=Trifolium pratense TaxID=57577 RepID=Q2PER1_TRIPR|nr:hypothetical protein [Trifolium pratense]
MMKMKNMLNNGGSGTEPRGPEWEMRPGGMLVQRRTDGDSDRKPVQPPTIKVRVKYGSTYHEVNISSIATFGELKKMLTGPTGLHHLDQKIFYKDKERDSKAFLDIVGVKDKSKLVVMEDPISQEKRYLEMRKNANMEKAAKSISEISLEVDRLAGQVSAMETIISKGGKVVETDLLSLIEKLMNQLIKLDGIMVADGDVKLQRKMQVKRVQKYVETLDMLKIKNNNSNGHQEAKKKHQQKHSYGKRLAPIEEQPQEDNMSNGNHKLQPNLEQQKQAPQRNSNGHSSLVFQQMQHNPSMNSSASEVVVTTKWETFDSLPPLIPVTSTSSSSSTTNNSVPRKFNWEFFE